MLQTQEDFIFLAKLDQRQYGFGIILLMQNFITKVQQNRDYQLTKIVGQNLCKITLKLFKSLNLTRNTDQEKRAIQRLKTLINKIWKITHASSLYQIFFKKDVLNLIFEVNYQLQQFGVLISLISGLYADKSVVENYLKLTQILLIEQLKKNPLTSLNQNQFKMLVEGFILRVRAYYKYNKYNWENRSSIKVLFNKCYDAFIYYLDKGNSQTNRYIITDEIFITQIIKYCSCVKQGYILSNWVYLQLAYKSFDVLTQHILDPLMIYYPTLIFRIDLDEVFKNENYIKYAIYNFFKYQRVDIICNHYIPSINGLKLILQIILQIQCWGSKKDKNTINSFLMRIHFFSEIKHSLTDQTIRALAVQVSNALKKEQGIKYDLDNLLQMIPDKENLIMLNI